MQWQAPGIWDPALEKSHPSVVRGPEVRKTGLPLWCICPHLSVNRSHCVSTMCIPQNTTQGCRRERNRTSLAERHRGSEKQLWYIIMKHEGSEGAPRMAPSLSLTHTLRCCDSEPESANISQSWKSSAHFQVSRHRLCCFYQVGGRSWWGEGEAGVQHSPWVAAHKRRWPESYLIPWPEPSGDSTGVTPSSPASEPWRPRAMCHGRRPGIWNLMREAVFSLPGSSVCPALLTSPNSAAASGSSLWIQRHRGRPCSLASQPAGSTLGGGPQWQKTAEAFSSQRARPSWEKLHHPRTRRELQALGTACTTARTVAFCPKKRPTSFPGQGPTLAVLSPVPGERALRDHR